MSRFTARLLSRLLHPIFMPLIVLLLLMNIGSFLTSVMPLQVKATLAAVVLFTTVLIPLFLMWILRRLGLISSYEMPTAAERTYPVLAISVFYYVTYFLLKGIHISAIFSLYMLGCTLLAILTLAAGFFMKISLHMIGTGSLTGLFLGLGLNFGIDLTGWVLAWVLLSGIVGWARMCEGSHTPAEVYAGFLAGAGVMTGIMMLV